MDTHQKKLSCKSTPKSESLERLKQILSQLEQNLKDADDGDRKDISRHIKNTKMIIDRIKSLDS